MALNQRDDDDCKPCPYNAGSAYQNPPTSSDFLCFQWTQEAFLGSLLSGEDSVTAKACQYLQGVGDDGGSDLFWALYYLDMKYCGLAYVNGQPNLDRKF